MPIGGRHAWQVWPPGQSELVCHIWKREPQLAAQVVPMIKSEKPLGAQQSWPPEQSSGPSQFPGALVPPLQLEGA